MKIRASFVISILLLTLTLLLVTPIAAAGRKPKEKANVIVSGDMMGSGLELDVYGIGKLVIIDGPLELTFEGTPEGLWWNGTHDFRDTYEGKLGIRIDKRTREADIIYNFDRYTEGEIDERYVGWFKYQLDGLGEWDGERIPYGNITVENEAFTIYQMLYTSMTKKKGKGATAVTYEPVWSNPLSFVISINPPS